MIYFESCFEKTELCIALKKYLLKHLSKKQNILFSENVDLGTTKLHQLFQSRHLGVIQKINISAVPLHIYLYAIFVVPQLYYVPVIS